ncbi:hypothetical protein [Kitasatospora acidiphila]|uniref:hypothetical protein n=1 Tax=Kitasatospora acidiphila TaxID=2567942 RepID=UPI003C75F8C8
MATILDGLGEKLVDKWLSALAVPGLLFMAAAATGAVLGQGAALDLTALRERVGHWAAEAGKWSTVGQLAAVAVIVLGSVAVGTFVQTCAGGVERVWTGDWPAPARQPAKRLTSWRRARWEEVQREINRVRAVVPAARRGEETRDAIDELTARRDGIALAVPSKPTFTGDRFAATDSRLRNQYGIDLASCWTRLWLVLPEPVRAELRTSRARFGAAVNGSTWAVCYVVLGLFWWPSAVAGIAAGLVAWSRGRRAATLHAELIESIVDLHLKTLAEELGVTVAGPVPDLQAGKALNRMFRKGA